MTDTYTLTIKPSGNGFRAVLALNGRPDVQGEGTGESAAEAASVAVANTVSDPVLGARGVPEFPVELSELDEAEADEGLAAGRITPEQYATWCKKYAPDDA